MQAAWLVRLLYKQLLNRTTYCTSRCSTIAQFESQNLSNRQQRAMLAAQQRAQFIGHGVRSSFPSACSNSARIGDIANMNFTAEQQVQLENSRAANT